MTQEKSVFAEASAPPTQGFEKKTGADLKEKVTRSAKDAGAAVKETVHQAAEEARQMGRDAAEELREHSEDFAQIRKSELGERIKGGGEAVRRAAEKLQTEDDPNIARYANALADRIVRAGDYVQSRDFREIRRDLESAVRRRPELVFGGMFLAGLAIARFLKASSPPYHEYDNEIDDLSPYEVDLTAEQASDYSPETTTKEPIGGSGEAEGFYTPGIDS